MVGQTTVEQIRETLRHEIAEDYAVGDLLPTERELAERFGVSRNTIRETIIHLEAFQLVEKTKRGPRVSKPNFDVMFRGFSQFFSTSAETFRDILNFRRINETGAAPLIAINADAETLAAMADANETMASALTASEAAAADFRFHLTLIDVARNEVISRMYRVMSVPVKFYLEVGKSHGAATNAAYEQHCRIIEALGTGDEGRVVQSIEAHFQHSGEVLMTWLATRPGESKSIVFWPEGDAMTRSSA